MSTLTRDIVVKAPVKDVFDYVLDVRKLWSAVPDVAVTEVVATPEGVGTSARIWSHFLGFHIEGGLEYKEVTRPERIVIEVSFFLEHPTWTFTFAPVHGGTKVTGQGEWQVNAPVVGKPMENMMVKEHEPFLEGMLAALKADFEDKAA